MGILCFCNLTALSTKRVNSSVTEDEYSVSSIFLAG
ncbi:hypothetical protein BMETH_844_0 [methanotrophic bacterial endosymbiont of Bathymodiolus sp.]|nr:hypothetical protein BMETH_844_0 [methanotrophic bacterial endosymbiont of Bathymodiolus sp.]